jgi:hypothetical protein
MNLQATNEIRELTANELDAVTGGSIIRDAIIRMVVVALAEKATGADPPAGPPCCDP